MIAVQIRLYLPPPRYGEAHSLSLPAPLPPGAERGGRPKLEAKIHAVPQSKVGVKKTPRIVCDCIMLRRVCFGMGVACQSSVLSVSEVGGFGHDGCTYDGCRSMLHL